MLGYKSIDYTFQVNYKVKLPDFVLEEDLVMSQEVQIKGDRRNAVQQRAGIPVLIFYLNMPNSQILPLKRCGIFAH